MRNHGRVDGILPLNEALLCRHKTKVNLLAVVSEFTFPLRSRGTDYYCTMTLVDESHPTDGLSVTVFARQTEELPQVKVGDLIYLSQVMMTRRNGDLCAFFNKASSFALFHGKFSNDMNPYQVSSRYQPTNYGDLIVHLRQWLLNFQLVAGRNKYLLSLKDITDSTWFDLVCKILYAREVSENMWILYVWDGTDTPPLEIKRQVQDEVDNPLPLQVEPASLSRDILRTFHRVGSILRIEVDQAHEDKGLHLLCCGQWVRLRNILCVEHSYSGLWKGFFSSSAKIYNLSDEHYNVQICKGNFSERISSKRGRLPLSSLPCDSRITVTDNKRAPILTLMDVLAHEEEFFACKCMVRVVAMCPWRPEDFRSPIDTQYRIRMTLEDPTARIHAYVCAADGNKFFEGYPPIEVLRRKRNKLLGIAIKDNGEEDESKPRNPPWIRCFIKSFYKKEDGAETRKFWIFGTTLLY